MHTVCVEGWRGLFWALLPAIIHLSLGDSLINAAFLQLTSKVTGIVGTQLLPFAAAPEEGNGRIIPSPRGQYSLFLPFSPSVLHSNCLSLILLVCLSVSSLLPFIYHFVLWYVSQPKSCLSFSVFLSVTVQLIPLLTSHWYALIWNAIKSCKNGMSLKMLDTEKGILEHPVRFIWTQKYDTLSRMCTHRHTNSSFPFLFPLYRLSSQGEGTWIELSCTNRHLAMTYFLWLKSYLLCQPVFSGMDRQRKGGETEEGREVGGGNWWHKKLITKNLFCAYIYLH